MTTKSKRKAMSENVIIQTAVGDYRQAVMEIVTEKLQDQFLLVTGDVYFEESTKTRVQLPDKNIKLVRNLFLFKRKFLIQFGVIKYGILAKGLILELNPRIINTWFLIFIRKALGKKTVLWGHAWPRLGRHSKSDNLRNVLRSLASHILVYTDTQVLELKEKMTTKSISSAPNSLYKSEEMWIDSKDRTGFIYVGRLVESKKPQLMINSYSNALNKEPSLGDLVIVGDGPERKQCEDLVSSLKLNDKVFFKGHISDLGTLRTFYETSVASLSPGYVGLSITQSFSFGTPILISRDENHAPEIEAAVEGHNCLMFDTNSSSDMSSKMLELWRGRAVWGAKEDDIIQNCKNTYSAEIMANSIIEAFNKCKI
ncbi:glycosyltransferase [Paraglaciecola marina]|uniref:glycosyltransferase n=1 Tax=Paraglaciecola marina TaxID=2500157 RepID=UPI001414FB36|nr:glycosyltransferase [Paraglaciecola marina]